MPTSAFGETSGTPDAFKLHDTDAILPLPLHGFPHTMSVLQINRSAISPYASLGKAGDLVCEGLGLGPRSAECHYLLAGPDPQAFFRWYLAANKNNFHRPTLPHQTGEGQGLPGHPTKSRQGAALVAIDRTTPLAPPMYRVTSLSGFRLSPRIPCFQPYDELRDMTVAVHSEPPIDFIV